MKKIFIFFFVLLIVLASASAAKLPLVNIPNQPELDGKQQVAGRDVKTNVDINKLPYSIIQKQSVIVSYKSSTETCPPLQIIESFETQTCPINLFSTTDTTTVHIVPVQKSTGPLKCSQGCPEGTSCNTAKLQGSESGGTCEVSCLQETDCPENTHCIGGFCNPACDFQPCPQGWRTIVNSFCFCEISCGDGFCEGDEDENCLEDCPLQSITGAIVYEPEQSDKTSIAITVILLLCITSLILITKGAASNKTRIIFVVIVMFIIGFAVTKAPTGPTGFAVQEFEESKPEALVLGATGCVIVDISEQQPDVICPREAPECSDGIDNDGDGFIDFPDDPGCSGPDDDLELDMLEYDDVVIDNEIDVYDIVNWIQYFNGDFSVLVDCLDATCSNQVGTANCVGDTDPDNSGGLSAADQTFLQTTQLADTDSRTVPIASPICFNPT